MGESHAWLQQAISDREAAEREREAVSRIGSTAWCHPVAKYQQTVEKAIKAVVAALWEAGFTNVPVGRAHEVTPYMRMLIRLSRPDGKKIVQQQLRTLLDSNTRARIKVLESLAPRWPAPGEPPRRNTEYPFHDTTGDWTHPAAEGVFTRQEVEAFRALAGRILRGAEHVLPAIRRVPK